MVKLPAVGSLKDTVSSQPSPCPKPSIVNCCSPASLSQFLRTIFNGFLSGLFFFFFGGEGGLLQKPAMPLILNYESEVINATAKEAFLLVEVSGGMDPGLPHGFL